jgi:maltose/moltooligosaccharide transporter
MACHTVFAEWFGIAKTAATRALYLITFFILFIGAAVLIGAILWTVIKTKEYPPEEYAKFHEPDVTKRIIKERH